MTVNGVSSALSAIGRQSAAMDRAAEKIARATSTPSSAAVTPEKVAIEQSQEGQLLDGTVEMLVAKRMFTAALKVAQNTNDGVLEALRDGGYGVAA